MTERDPSQKGNPVQTKRSYRTGDRSAVFLLLLRVFFVVVVFCGNGRRCLLRRMPEDILAVGVEAQVPETDRLHKLLGLLKLALPSKHGVDELDAGSLPQLRIPLLAAGEHGLLASLEQLLELVDEALSPRDEAIHQIFVVRSPDPRKDLLGTLDLATELDQK